MKSTNLGKYHGDKTYSAMTNGLDKVNRNFCRRIQKNDTEMEYMHILYLGS